MTRKQAREQAFILIFEKSFRPDEDVLDIAEDAYEDEQIEKDDFALMLAKKTQDNMEDIDIYSNKLHNELGFFYKFNLDVGEYKLKQQRNIERMAIRVAKDVAKSHVEAKLDPMNSYERRLVHNVLNDWKDVYTESTGEEPNRCVVIKPREE